jgi:hypothetical protein
LKQMLRSNSEAAKSCNFEDKAQAQTFTNSVLARLSSVVTDRVMCDILCLLDEHS